MSSSWFGEDSFEFSRWKRIESLLCITIIMFMARRFLLICVDDNDKCLCGSFDLQSESTSQGRYQVLPRQRCPWRGDGHSKCGSTRFLLFFSSTSDVIDSLVEKMKEKLFLITRNRKHAFSEKETWGKERHPQDIITQYGSCCNSRQEEGRGDRHP